MASWLIFPHHVRIVWTMQGRRKAGPQGYGMSCASGSRVSAREVRRASARGSVTKRPDPTLPRKAAKEIRV